MGTVHTMQLIDLYRQKEEYKDKRKGTEGRERLRRRALESVILNIDYSSNSNTYFCTLSGQSPTFSVLPVSSTTFLQFECIRHAGRHDEYKAPWPVFTGAEIFKWCTMSEPAIGWSLFSVIYIQVRTTFGSFGT